MKQNILICTTLLAGLVLTTACSNEENLAETAASEEADVTASASISQGTHTKLTPTDNSTYLSLSWQDEDKISVMKGSSDKPVEFSKKADTNISSSGSGATATSSMTFSGSIAVEPDERYYAIYPTVSETDKASSVTLDMTGQNGTLNGNKIYMYAYSGIDNNKLTFKFTHLTSVLKFALQVYPYSGYLDADGTIEPINQAATSRAETRDATDCPTHLKSISFTAAGLEDKPTKNLVDLANASSSTVSSRATSEDGGLSSTTTTSSISLTLTPSDATTGFALTDGKTTTLYLHFVPDSFSSFTVTATDDLGNTHTGTISVSSSPFTASTMYNAGTVTLTRETVQTE